MRMWTAGLVQLGCSTSSTGMAITTLELAADNFPGSVSRRHQARTPFLACLLVSPSCPAAPQTTYLLFFPLHSLLLHFSVARKTLHRHWHSVSADCTQNSKSSLAALDSSQHRLPAKDLHPKEVYLAALAALYLTLVSQSQSE